MLSPQTMQKFLARGPWLIDFTRSSDRESSVRMALKTYFSIHQGNEGHAFDILERRLVDRASRRAQNLERLSTSLLRRAERLRGRTPLTAGGANQLISQGVIAL